MIMLAYSMFILWTIQIWLFWISIFALLDLSDSIICIKENGNKTLPKDEP